MQDRSAMSYLLFLNWSLEISCFFFLMIRQPPRSTLFPTRRSSDLLPSRYVSVGPERAPQRSYYYAMGMTEEEIARPFVADRKSTRLNSSHSQISYAVFCLKKKNIHVSQKRHCRLTS